MGLRWDSSVSRQQPGCRAPGNQDLDREAVRERGSVRPEADRTPPRPVMTSALNLKTIVNQ
jgi:hypothetical protein